MGCCSVQPWPWLPFAAEAASEEAAADWRLRLPFAAEAASEEAAADWRPQLPFAAEATYEEAAADWTTRHVLLVTTSLLIDAGMLGSSHSPSTRL